MLINAIRLVRAAAALAWLAATVVLVALVALPNVLPAVGRELYVVRGASMQPALPLGSAVIVRLGQADQLAVGDVITFRGGNGTIVTHRIIGVSAGADRAFQTKGDASLGVDPTAVPASALIGRVEYVLPGVGAVLASLATTSGGLAALGLLGGLLLSVWIMDHLLTALRSSSRRRTVVAEPAH